MPSTKRERNPLHPIVARCILTCKDPKLFIFTELISPHRRNKQKRGMVQLRARNKRCNPSLALAFACEDDE